MIGEFTTVRHRTRAGATLAIRVYGGGPRSCVLIHGLGEGAYVWDAFAKELSATHTVLAMDLRGHGHSDWVDSCGYCGISYAEDIMEVLDQHCQSGAALVGHSMGAEVCIRVAVERPQLVYRLILADYGLGIGLDVRMMLHRLARRCLRRYGSTEEFAKVLGSTRPLVARPVLHEMATQALRLEETGKYALRFDPKLLRSPYVPPHDSVLTGFLKSVKCPTLVMRGELSAVLTAKGAVATQQCIGDARIATLSSAGHGLIHDNPAEFSFHAMRLLRDFPGADPRYQK